MKIVLRFSPQFTRHIRYMMSTFKCYSLLSYDKLKLIQFQWVCTPIFLNVQPRWGRRNKSKLNCLVMECWWAGWEEYLGAYQKSLPYYKQPKTRCCILTRGDPKVLIHFSVKMLRVSTAGMLKKCQNANLVPRVSHLTLGTSLSKCMYIIEYYFSDFGWVGCGGFSFI